MMKISAIGLALSLSLVNVAQAGCLSGAVAGGVIGHFAGHHGLAGAAVGCAVGHHHSAMTRHDGQGSHGDQTNPDPSKG
jgi:uncharacterized membrane protein